MAAYTRVTLAAAIFVVGVLFSALPSHQEITYPTCKLDAKYTKDKPCLLDVYLSQQFVIDCGAGSTSQPAQFLNASMKMCETSPENVTTKCPKEVEMTPYVKSMVVDTNTWTATMVEDRDVAFKKSVVLYGVCQQGVNSMWVQLTIHPLKLYPTYYTKSCDSTDSKYTNNNGVCFAMGFAGETLNLLAAASLNTVVPSDALTTGGSACSGSIVTGDACAAPSTATTWANILGATPKFGTLPAGKTGIVYEIPASPAKDASAGFLLKDGTPNRFYENLIVIAKKRPAAIPADVVFCDSGTCDVTLDKGKSVLMNCYKHTNTNPTDLLKSGKLCKTAPTPTGGSCSGDNLIDATTVGLTADLDTIDGNYVLFTYSDQKKYDTTVYGFCGAIFPTDLKLKLKGTDGPSTSAPTTTSSAQLTAQLSGALLTIILAFVFFNSAA